MKITIRLFDEIDLEVALRQDAEGVWQFSGCFPTFLHRGGKPHVSIFAEPKQPIHFTSFQGNPREFRRKLTSMRSERVLASLNQSMETLIQRFMGSLEQVDLEQLERDGWLLHGVKPRAVARWLHRGIGTTSPIEVTEEQVLTFLCHVLRTCCPPTDLVNHTGPGHALVMRNVEEKLRVKTIYFFEHGLQTPDGEPSPSGWYWSVDGWDATLRDQLRATSPLVPMFERLEKCLERAPRRKPFEDFGLPEEISELSYALGFYAEELVNLVLRLAVGSRLRAA